MICFKHIVSAAVAVCMTLSTVNLTGISSFAETENNVQNEVVETVFVSAEETVNVENVIEANENDTISKNEILNKTVSAVITDTADDIGELSEPEDGGKSFAVALGDAEVVSSGTCGDDLAWTLDEEGTLVIFGTGDMYDYVNQSTSVLSTSPFYKIRSSIKTIIVQDGVTSIGNRAFYGCTALTDVVIADSVSGIGTYVFSSCNKLVNMTVPFIGSSVKTPQDTYQYPFGYFFGTSSYTGGTKTSQRYYGSSLTETTTTSYYIPSTLRTVTVTGGNILYGAFHGCSKLTTIIVPENITSIGDDAFMGCNALTSFVIPENVTEIGSGAFSDCTGLKEAVIPYGVTSISSFMFSGCTNLVSVSIPDSVSQIGVQAFYECSALKNITIPNLVTTIENSVFNGCSSLTDISIPDSVTTIGDGAFGNCKSLTNIVVPDTVTYIGKAAFGGCSSLESITLPFVGQSVKTAIDTYQYPLGYIFGSVSYTGSVSAQQSYYADSKTSATSTYYYIPATLKTVTVTGGSILRGAFQNCSQITAITIPDDITSIGAYAFNNCSSLIGLDIPDTVTVINNYAFSGCSSLTGITIPNNVININSNAFSNCTALTDITVPESVNTIGTAVFNGCANLKSITLPFVGSGLKKSTDTQQYPFGYIFGTTSYTGGVKTVQTYHSSSLTSTSSSSYYIPSSLEKVVITGGEMLFGAFRNCSKITSITMPDGITEISDYAFSGCEGLTAVSVPYGVTSIGSYAFDGCLGAESIDLPDTVSSIGEYAFRSCSSLKTAVIPDGVTTIAQYLFSGCCALSNVTLPSEIDSIGVCAFADCSSLESVIIPQGVISIGQSAFNGCSAITGIEFPSSVTSIGSYAFQDCIGFTSLSIPDTVNEIGIGAFNGCSNLENITVPFVGASLKTSSDKYQYPFGYIFGTASYTDGVKVSQTYYGSSTSTTTSSNYYIPKALKSVTVTGGNILRGAFQNCSDIETIIIPDSITSIGIQAFSNCTNLKDITISDSITTINNYAFNACVSLTDIYIPKTVTTISNTAFSSCTNLIIVCYRGSAASTYAVNNSIAVSYLCDHTWGEWSITESTCMREGYRERVCSSCSETERETIAISDHKWSEWITVEADCVTDGYSTRSCVYCNESEFVVIPKTDHNWNEWIVTDATCTEQGYKERNCVSCGVTENVVTAPANGHTWSDWSITEPACTKDGIKERYCLDCDEKESSVILISGHNWSSWIVVEEPTTTKEGKQLRYCSVCNINEIEIIPVLPIPELITENYTVRLTDARVITHIRYACGVYTTSSGIKNADDCVNLDSSVISENVVDGTFEYDMPDGGIYSLWIKLIDGTSYILTADLTVMEQEVETHSVTVILKNLYGVKDYFIAKGVYDNYTDLRANSLVQITQNKIKGARDYKYILVSGAGTYTICVRYSDTAREYKFITFDVEVTEPTFEANGLQLTVGNIDDVKVIRTAYGSYKTPGEVKRAQGSRSFTAKTVLKGLSEYTIQFRDNGTVTVAVAYNSGYEVVYTYEVQQKTPTFINNGKTVIIGDLDGLKLVRYAEGEYDTSNQIKKAPGSKVIKPDSIVNGYIVLELNPGTYTFCVQYDDESYNYYNIVIE